jgi:RimJ/RimL family protein N-acetyltransferase
MDFGAANLTETGAAAAIGEVFHKGGARNPATGGLRYPVELIDMVRLGAGQRVTIRPLLPQDDAVTKAFFQALSARSRHNRFMRTFRDLPDDLLRQLVHVDYHTHLALIAEVFTSGQEIAIGESRYVVSPDGKSAEFAVSIADDWQGRGLGTLLLCRLIKLARRAGGEKIAGETLASNTAMLHLAHKAGFSYELDAQIAGLVHLSLSFAK